MKIIVITPPDTVSDEIETINRLFGLDLEILHLRKPGYDSFELEGLLRKIDRRYHNRIMLHAHHHLVEQYQRRGSHFPAAARNERREYSNQHCSTSCHNIEELERFGADYEYLMVSPVFDSISKPGYCAKIDTGELQEYIARSGNHVVGLGGVDQRTLKMLPRNCWGAAVLGEIWRHKTMSTRVRSLGRLKTIAEAI